MKSNFVIIVLMKLLFQILSILIGLAIFLIGAYYLTLWATHDYSSNFLQSDSCLRNGGVYVNEEEKCYLPGVCEDEGGKWNGIDKKCDR